MQVNSKWLCECGSSTGLLSTYAADWVCARGLHKKSPLMHFLNLISPPQTLLYKELEAFQKQRIELQSFVSSYKRGQSTAIPCACLPICVDLRVCVSEVSMWVDGFLLINTTSVFCFL